MRSQVAMILIIAMMLSSAPIYAVDLGAAADYTLSKARSLSNAQIESVKTNIESEFGQDTVFRWDKFASPKLVLKCYDRWVDRAFVFLNREYPSAKKYPDLQSYKMKKIDSQKIREIVSDFYYSADAASRNRYGVKVDPYLLYTISMSEGFNIFTEDYYCNHIFSGGHIEFDYGWYPVYTSGARGVEDNENALKQGGFLRSDFDTNCYWVFWIGGTRAKYNKCGTIKESIEVTGAFVAYAKWLFLVDAKNLGISEAYLSNPANEDVVNFWTYFYFNAGSGTGKKTLMERIQIGDWNSDFIRTRQGETTLVNQCSNNARKNAIIRAAVAKFIRELDIFSK
jgi:hypothetical protein